MQFGSHCQRSSQLSLGHVVSAFGKSKISNNDGIIVEENVGQFKVPMHDFIPMQHLEPIHNLLQVVNGLLLIDQSVFLLCEMTLKVAIVAILHDKVIIIAWFEKLEEVHNVGMVDVVHNSDFGLQQLLEHGVLVDHLWRGQERWSWDLLISKCI